MLSKELKGLNLQFFSENKGHWYFDVLKKEAEESDYGDEVIALMQKINTLDGNEDIQKIQEIKKEVDETKIPEIFKEKLFRRIRTFEVRANREVPDSFRSLLRYLRKSQKLSFKELADKSGVTASYIQRLESGTQKSPSIKVIENLSNALGQDLSKAAKGNSTFVEDEIKTLQEILLSTTFKINNREVNAREKEKLVNLLEKITVSNFNGTEGQANMVHLTYQIAEFNKMINEDKE